MHLKIVVFFFFLNLIYNLSPQFFGTEIHSITYFLFGPAETFQIS